jgi:HEPN domain-containing protein
MPEPDLVKEWLRYANNDLTVACHVLDDLYPKQTEISAYHCQQCAEKALKAFLFFNDIEPPKTHNLIKLAGLCKDFSGDFSEIELDCRRLDPFGAEVRYPNELAPDESTAKAAIEQARRIYDFCAAKIAVSQIVRKA